MGDNYALDVVTVVAARAAGLQAVYLDRTGAGPVEEPCRIVSLSQLARLF